MKTLVQRFVLPIYFRFYKSRDIYKKSDTENMKPIAIIYYTATVACAMILFFMTGDVDVSTYKQIIIF